MKIVFMGTPEFAVLPLRILVEEGYEVAAVVTQPDRPVGRKKVLTPGPVKTTALELGIPVLQPAKIRQPEAYEELQRLAPDLIVTAAYGQILPKQVLDLPRLGCINLHASLLPKYRGAAPVHYALMNGETVTGVTIMYMEEGLDTGPMISKVEVPIEAEDDTGTLLDKLSRAGAQLLKETLPKLIQGQIKSVPQNDAEATYAPTIKREDERIDWQRSASEIHHLVRALSPEPGAFTLWNQSVLKIRQTQLPDGVNHRSNLSHTVSAASSQPEAGQGAAPGTVIGFSPDGIQVATGNGVLLITKLQPAGKKTMDAAQFLRGNRMQEGDRLGDDPKQQDEEK